MTFGIGDLLGVEVCNCNFLLLVIDKPILVGHDTEGQMADIVVGDLDIDIELAILPVHECIEQLGEDNHQKVLVIAPEAVLPDDDDISDVVHDGKHIEPHQHLLVPVVLAGRVELQNSQADK